MKCSQCSADLPDATAFCPRCGTSTYTSRTSRFSYLPPGTPPWPATIPQQLPGTIEMQNETSTSSINGKKAPARSGRRTGSILGIIAALVIAPLVAALITAATLYSNGQITGLAAKPASKSNSQSAAATPQTSSKPANSLPTPTSFKTATNTNINMSVKYPSDWTLGSPQQSTAATSLTINSQDQIGISFVINRLSSAINNSISSVDDLNASTVQGLQQIQGSHEIQTVQAANANPTIAGDKWSQKDATLLDSQNTKIHFTTIADKHSKTYYVIYFLVPDNIYQEALQKYLNPMLSSAKFLS
ncbi:zinc ribbon domain-containing protein [Dictyobacter aurantiacus]|uniref:Zinc-ribbon domain-containing protein n=1 Tax=Dictyobacter aurantiacus TaxID=1936993 RepID=A0A401ZF99_9CHLR|nr:zinc ribbon domain-containing protein [Dictyobacter aurantiacus]GCE05473.1 hypothetical protein KDAU_28020 [Dictyobacter aurantiacus]